MTMDIPTMLPALIQIALLIVLLVLSVRLIRENGRSLTAVFLTFVYALWLFTDLYWVIYYVIRPEVRMPFAVNEIGEAAILLLMSALLSSAVNYRAISSRKQAVGAVLFAVCNVALWAAWSGEWVQDVLIGAAFTYFLYHAVSALNSRRCLSEKEWIGLGIGSALLILAQSLTFFTGPPLKKALETCCYVYLAAGIVYWAVKLTAARNNQASPKTVLCLVFVLMSWSLTAKYMSDGMWYTVFMATESIVLLLMYLSVRKAVTEA